MPDGQELQDAARVLAAFIGDGELTSTIADLEHALDGRRGGELRELLSSRRVSLELLRSALLIRGQLGRINDVIHAVGIGLALEELIEPGEVLSRPSLAAGNDPSRPYDLETDRRVAEFKFGRWDAGSNAARKREAFKDLVGLAADDSERRAELYVLGPRPIRFLRETRSTARWALNKSIRMTELYERRFGSLDTPISAFVSGPAQAVAIMDLEQRLPHLFDPALDGTSD